MAPASYSGNSRSHWAQKYRDGHDYGETVYLIAKSASREWGNWERAHVTVTQYACKPRDHDNFAASFKPGLDAIVKAGYIADDKPSCIDLSLRAVKVNKRADERVEITIEELVGAHEQPQGEE